MQTLLAITIPTHRWSLDLVVASRFIYLLTKEEFLPFTPLFNLKFMTNGKSTPPSLIYIDDFSRGYKRVKRKDAFIYQNHLGKPILNEKTITRIKKMVIPPMWEEVWICNKSNGHIQATGLDAKGRKQYLYHAAWSENLNHQKYNDLLKFAQKLPLIRQQVEKDLRRRIWGKEKVLALAVKLMDELFLRVGNKFYKDENGTFGLTTLRKKHLQEEKKHLQLKYMAKSGKLRQITVNHPTLRRMLKQCSELPGYELFRYKNGKNYETIDSREVNEYLRKASSAHITAKDFRTWGGTVLAVKYEPLAREMVEVNPRQKLETTLVRLIANKLNNTVSVCRKYYVHPKVLQAVLNSEIEKIQIPLKKSPNKKWYSQEELKVIGILKQEKE